MRWCCSISTTGSVAQCNPQPSINHPLASGSAVTIQVIENIRVNPPEDCPEDMGTEADVKLNFEGNVSTEARIGGALQALKDTDPAVMATHLVTNVEREVANYLGTEHFRVRPPTFERLKEAVNAKIKGVVVQEATTTQVITNITVETCVGIELTNRGVINLSANNVAKAAADTILQSPEWGDLVRQYFQTAAPENPSAQGGTTTLGIAVDFGGLLGKWQVQASLAFLLLVMILLVLRPRGSRR